MRVEVRRESLLGELGHRQAQHFLKADPDYGKGVAEGRIRR